jgi:hypothetical protein
MKIRRLPPGARRRLAVAPWLLGFADDGTATFMHLAGRSHRLFAYRRRALGAERTPLRRFRPGAERHADVFDVINDDNADDRAGNGALVCDTLSRFRAERALERRKRRPRSVGSGKCANRVGHTARGDRHVPARAHIA